MLPQFFFLFVDLDIDLLLMLLDLHDFELIRLFSQSIGHDVLLHHKMSPLLVSQVAAPLAQSEGVVAAHHILAHFGYVQVLFVPQFPQALVSSCLIVLHVGIPSAGEVNELSSLYVLNLLEFQGLALLHLVNSTGELYFAQLVELDFGVPCFQVSLLCLQLFVVVSQYSQKCGHFEVRKAVNPRFWQHLTIFFSK